MTATVQNIPPSAFMQAAMGMQHSSVIRAAVELDIFTTIHTGRRTAAELAAETGASPKGMRVLCDALTIQGLLLKNDGEYSLSPEAAVYLDRNAPSWIGSVALFLTSTMMTSAFQHFTDAVRHGGTVEGRMGSIEPDHPVWIEFARWMAPMMTPPARALTELAGPVTKVLDIAAGHGVFGIEFAKANPTAEVHALDSRGVLDLAEENAVLAGVGERWHRIDGSAFDADFGAGYDVVLCPNFFHHFDREQCVQLARKAHAALQADCGRMLTLEFVPNDDRVTPAQSAWFATIMLATTPQGDAYTFSEYQQIFREAGFSHSELAAPRGAAQQVIISTK